VEFGLSASPSPALSGTLSRKGRGLFLCQSFELVRSAKKNAQLYRSCGLRSPIRYRHSAFPLELESVRHIFNIFDLPKVINVDLEVTTRTKWVS